MRSCCFSMARSYGIFIMSVVTIATLSRVTFVRAFSKCPLPKFLRSSTFTNSRSKVTLATIAHPSVLFASNEFKESSSSLATNVAKKRVAIVGGGLAGLSTAYHLLQKTQKSGPQVEICVFDNHPVGTGGASAIAGGLLHPLSPSGKLVYLGLEGLEASNQLLNAACFLFKDKSESSSLSSVVLQDSVYRVALSTEQQVSLQALASTNREALEAANVRCQWLSPGELNGILYASFPSTKSDSPRSHFGALVLSGSARVIHVPSYLQGLWKACCHISNQTSQWILTDQLARVSNKDWLERLQNEFDVVVLAAGAGLFQPPHVSEGCGGETTSQNPHVLDSEHSLIDSKDFPVQLVRGQSVEMQRQQGEEISPSHLSPLPPALVCGKYVLPTLRNDRILVGATHEFQSVPWTTDRVLQELRERTTKLLPNIWETRKETDVETDAVKWEIAQVSSGVRVQANRSAHGRLPIIGRLHSNVWIFTGLSSRGLLYHGLFGDYLTNSILNTWTDKFQDPHGCNEELSEDVPVSQPVDLDWWRKKTGVKH